MAVEFGKTNATGTATNERCRSSSAGSESNLADHAHDGIAAAKLVYPDLTIPTPRITPMPGISEALLPCPFCGGKPRYYRDGRWRQAECTACNIETALYSTDTEAAFSWNRRAPLTAALSGQVVVVGCDAVQSRHAIVAIYCMLACIGDPEKTDHDVARILCDNEVDVRAFVAQRIEQGSSKPEVAGSIPAERAPPSSSAAEQDDRDGK